MIYKFLGGKKAKGLNRIAKIGQGKERKQKG